MVEIIDRAKTLSERVQPVASGTVRLLVAAFLSYIFVIILMTAAAQSEVAHHLGTDDYSTARSKWLALRKDDETEDNKEGSLDLQLAVAKNNAASAERIHKLAGDRYLALEAPVRTAVTALAGKVDCGLSPLSDLDTTNVGSTIDVLKRCAAEQEFSPKLKSIADTATASQKQVMDAADDWSKSGGAVSMFKNEQDAIQAKIAELDRYNGIFGPISVLESRATLGGWLLTQFPPTMLQIISAFFSGLFGALLVTLVLVVYPGNDIGITTPGGNFGERILLGGLIAVCVLIVLGGGTAVLGSDSAFSNGNANYMAFSAICVMAGMFSDRVAKWLSDRASFFYSSAANAVAPAPKSAPGPSSPT